ncbi:MAG TPA: hypothetical protein VKQ36_01180, partial [Ktedonobacterales bacterium]|nr:hypothetical protein [Ktedonobacterales bacterium]
LKVYAGPTHPHQAQKPIPWSPPTVEDFLSAEAAVADDIDATDAEETEETENTDEDDETEE